MGLLVCMYLCRFDSTEDRLRKKKKKKKKKGKETSLFNFGCRMFIQGESHNTNTKERL